MSTDDREFLERATQCVYNHISDSDYDRETFASDMGTSVSTLYTRLRELTGKSMINFIRDIRIQEACRIAKAEPNARVSDIAYRVGFRDAKYFATAFKRIMGKQPKEYFAELRGEN
jgi:AraC-like DNA-binding protein